MGVGVRLAADAAPLRPTLAPYRNGQVGRAGRAEPSRPSPDKLNAAVLYRKTLARLAALLVLLVLLLLLLRIARRVKRRPQATASYRKPSPSTLRDRWPS